MGKRCGFLECLRSWPSNELYEFHILADVVLLNTNKPPSSSSTNISFSLAAGTTMSLLETSSHENGDLVHTLLNLLLLGRDVILLRKGETEVIACS
jgi:hypothetical protein